MSDAVLAARLWRQTQAALAAGRAAELTPPEALWESIERFLAEPAASTFLAAVRVAEQHRRRAEVESAGSGVLRRSFEDGAEALAAAPGIPAALASRLATELPVDLHAGDRLRALAALASAHHALASRVSADLAARRRLFQSFPGRGRRPGRGSSRR
jgi:hypothetical protein